MNLLTFVNYKKYFNNEDKINLDNKIIVNNIITYPNLNNIKIYYTRFMSHNFMFCKLFFISFIFNFIVKFKK